MACGFSGSNSGVPSSENVERRDKPLEVSYFVDNLCNLECKHCYVGYQESRNALSIEEWQRAFDDALTLGALTFGNVGKEPLLNWRDKTLPLLHYFREKRTQSPKLRYGLVTNATLFDEERVRELVEASPTYLDISLDGTREVHDGIRGAGNYDKTINTLSMINGASPETASRIFVSLTLMKPNKDITLLRNLSGEIKRVGVRNLLVSPYVKSVNEVGDLGLTEDEIVDFYKDLTQQGNDFVEGQLLLKSDFDTQEELIRKLVKSKVIDLENLLVDDYGVIFNRFGRVFVNYMPASQTMTTAIRISHDGFVSGCYDMFFRDYPKRVSGSLRLKTLKEIMNC